MNRKLLATLVIGLVIIMNFFIIIQNQYIPQSTNLTGTKSNQKIPSSLPELEGTPSFVSTNDEPYPDIPNEIEGLAKQYLSDYYYRYKEFVFEKINSSLTYIFRDLMNASDGGFYNFINLTAGGQNNTRKYTSANALMIISLIDTYLNNKSLNYLQQVNKTMDFMINNLYFNISIGELGTFINYIENNGSNPSNLSTCIDNALAILSLLKVYQITQNMTLLEIANRTLTYMNEILWDSEYGGYYQNNATINGSKYTIDNLFATWANLEVYRTIQYDYEYQINAFKKAETIIGKVFENFNESIGLTIYSSRNWSIDIFANQTDVNALGILTLLKYNEFSSNETLIRMAENISTYLRRNFYDPTFLGFNHSISDTTKYLEENSWVIQALLGLFEKTQNISYYLQGLNISYFINNNLWDSYNNIYNYSIDSGSSAQNWTIKNTEANSITLQSLLKFKFPNYYLTRANTTMNILLSNVRPGNVGFYSTLSRAHSQYSSSKFEEIKDDFLAIIALCELGSEINLTSYFNSTAFDIYNRTNSLFYNATEGSYKTGYDQNGILINEISLIENTYAILALSELYKITNDTNFIEAINKTWYYINNSLWDVVNNGYYNKSNGEINRNSMDQFLMILANLEVANISYFPSLQGNASKMANITLQLINNKMWDNESGGYYKTANQTWGIDSGNKNIIDAKKLDSNSLSIIVQLKYIELFPSDINNTVYTNRINQTISFIENNLWDGNSIGFFDFSNYNGTIIGLNKSTTDNCWAILAYNKLFEVTNNYSYYSKSEEILKFINFYLWDFEVGGYFTGYYNQKIASRDIKTPFSEFMVIRSLSALSRTRERLTLPPLINIEFNTTKLNSLGIYIDTNVLVYDTDGNRLESANVSIFLSGFVDNEGLSPIYGLGQKFNFTSKILNIYNFNLDCSPYYGRIYVNPFILNESYGASWDLFLLNRTFSTYQSRVFSTINSLTMSFYDFINHGFYRVNGTNLSKYTEDNFYAISLLSEFISSTGLNIAINWSTVAFGQIMINYSINTLNFLISKFLVGNSSFGGFLSEGNYNGSIFSNTTQCKDNARAIIAFLDVFKLTNDTTYLEFANATWNYLNLTFWDNIDGGYNSTNQTSSQATKNLYDNFLAILANLAIAENVQINQIIRTKALELANFTLNETVSKLWDSSNSGFFSRFNFSWQPIHEIDEKSTMINSLAILTMIKYLSLYPNDVNNNTYYTKINQTSDFMYNYLWDSGYLGFFSYYNNSVGITNTNKTLIDNAIAISAFSELYNFTKNYSNYIIAEKISFFINSYFWVPSLMIGVFVNKSSIYGTIGPGNTVDTVSSIAICRALIYLSSIQLNLKNPPEARNFTVEQKIVGKIEDLYDIEIEIFDEYGSPLQNGTAFAIVYSKDQLFNFTNIESNRYKATVNVSQLSFIIQINVLIFNKSSFTAGSYTFNFYRHFPIYIQIAHDTLNRLRNDFWDGLFSNDGFFYSQFDKSKYSYDNFLMLDAISTLNKTMGSIKYSFNWYANDTYDKLIDSVYNFLNTSLRTTNITLADNSSVAGFITACADDHSNPDNLTLLGDNAIAILSLLELYNQSGNSEFLKRANETWLYLNATFWDKSNGGYMTSNYTNANVTRDIFSNFLAILAALQINLTVEINSSIRENAFNMANETFYMINTTKGIWDPSNGGGYFATVNLSTGVWNTTNSNKSTLANSLGILSLLKFYKITNNSAYLNQSEYLADLMYRYLWDINDTGFYTETLANWSLSVAESDIIKYASPSAWAIMAFYELFNITSNFSTYIQAEKTMSFLNSFFLNFQIEDQIIYFLGFRENVNKSNFAGAYSFLDSNALLIKVLAKFFNLINSTFWNGTQNPWLTDNVSFTPGTVPGNGELMNITLSLLYNTTQHLNNANVTLNIIGFDTITTEEGSQAVQRFIYRINATFNSTGNNLYIAEFINISNAEDIYVCIFGINNSQPAFYNIYHVSRMQTSLDYQIFGIPTSPIAIKNKQMLPSFVPYDSYYRWKEFILGEDRITINATYGSEDFSFGQPITKIPNARVNFEILNPDGSLFINRTVLTTSNGIATISFGPTRLADEAVGIYNVTIIAQTEPSTTDPQIWYGSAVTKMYIQVGYGVYIAYISSLTNDVAQGDLLQCNLTLRNDRKTAAYINITASGDVFIENSSLINYLVDIGYTNQVILLKVDERTIPDNYYVLTVRLIFQEKYINNESITILVKSSTVSVNIGIPPQIAENDLRYAIIRVKNQKLLVDLNFSIEVFCPEALNYVRMNETLSPNAESYFYVPFTVKDFVPYNQFSGYIKVSWVNYSVSYSFSITVTPDLEIGNIIVPITIYQSQNSLLTIEVENLKSTPVNVLVAVVGTGNFQPIFINSYINEFSSNIIAVPCLFNPLPWDIGLKNLQIQVYLVSENGIELMYSRIFMVSVIISIPNILLLYVVPFISITLITILILNRVRKIKKLEKKKVGPEKVRTQKAPSAL